MAGMSAQTGRSIDGMDHLRQSVTDILTTPIGSRVMRREYGSLLPELIDQPLHGATLLRAYAATVLALTRWEPRLQITRVRQDVHANQPGALVLAIEGETQEGAAVVDVPLGRPQ
jgi:phage baseplate assembly protein W